MLEWEKTGPYGQVFSFGTPGKPLAEARAVLEKCEACHIGTTLDEVATAAGLDTTAVKATVERYNGYCDAAVHADGEDVSIDAEFGKRAKYLHKVAEGPYWLCEVADGFYTTCGGIKVNEKIGYSTQKIRLFLACTPGGQTLVDSTATPMT